MAVTDADRPIKIVLREVARQRSHGRSDLARRCGVLTDRAFCREVSDALIDLLHDPEPAVRLGAAEIICDLAAATRLTLSVIESTAAAFGVPSGNLCSL
jgi:hypothetical protein